MDDLISRNELLAGIDELIAGIAFTSPYQDELHCLIGGMERVRDRVEEAPTLTLDDLRPKGRWIKKTWTMRGVVLRRDTVCSECGFDAPEFAAGGGSTVLTRFCPSCGADMRGGGEDA